MARPFIDDLNKRSVVKTTRITEQESLALQAYLAEHGGNFSDLARRLLSKEIERDKQRKKKTSSKPKEERFKREVYRTAERLGRVINGMAFAFNAHPDKPPAAERVAFMLDELKPFAIRLMGEFPKHYKPDTGFRLVITGIERNLGQMLDRYGEGGRDLPPNLEDTLGLLGDIVDRLAAG